MPSRFRNDLTSMAKAPRKLHTCEKLKKRDFPKRKRAGGTGPALDATSLALGSEPVGEARVENQRVELDIALDGSRPKGAGCFGPQDSFLHIEEDPPMVG